LTQNSPALIRVSVGTAAVLGLQKTKLDAQPTTAYLLTYHDGKCTANCAFCPQARLSSSKTALLSRITWPTFPTDAVVAGLTLAYGRGKIKRICIQALNYPGVLIHLQTLVKSIKLMCPVPVSVSCQPLNKKNIALLKAAGVDRLGIALDAATEAVFNQVKGVDAGGCYRWKRQFSLFEEALAVFGKGNVSTHVIVGLGESEREAAEIIQRCVDMGILLALFAFTPVKGTALEKTAPPKTDMYRRVQLTRYLIITGKINSKELSFDENGIIQNFNIPKRTLQTIINSGKPFLTSGCPDCNRPCYNEKPSGPIYNYPQKPTKEEIKKIKTELK
jgi:lipoyl synthase